MDQFKSLVGRLEGLLPGQSSFHLNFVFFKYVAQVEKSESQAFEANVFG